MMWTDGHPVRTDWPTASVKPTEVLYEVEGPAFFITSIGLSNYFFFKKRELEESDLYLVCIAESDEIEALKEGRLSIRGAMNKRIGWLVEICPKGSVIRFQEQSHDVFIALLPAPGLALHAKFGNVPDSLIQANSLMAFKFYSDSMHDKSMPLRLLTETVEGVSKFVKGVLTPSALLEGRDGRFFDVRVNEPVFASLLISIDAPSVDAVGLRENKRTQNLSVAELESASIERGRETWSVIQDAVRSYTGSSVTKFNAVEHREFLDNIVDLMPTESNDFSKIEITFRAGARTEIVAIDRIIGEKFVKDHSDLDGQVLSIEGVITEVNGESGTFLIRDNSYSTTTCNPQGDLFQQLDDAGYMNRGQRMKVTGKYWRRTRRGFISFSAYPVILE